MGCGSADPIPISKRLSTVTVREVMAYTEQEEGLNALQRKTRKVYERWIRSCYERLVRLCGELHATGLHDDENTTSCHRFDG